MKKEINYSVIMVLVLCSVVVLSSKVSMSKGNLKLQQHLYIWFQIEEPFYLDNYNITLKSEEIMKDYYSSSGFQPGWVNEEGLKNAANQFIHTLGDAENEGLIPGEYHIKTIRELADRINSDGFTYDESRWRQLIIIDLLLTDAFFIYTSDRINGRLDKESRKRVWVKNSRGINFNSLLGNIIENDDITLLEETFAKKYRVIEYNYLKEMLVQYRIIKESGGWPSINIEGVIEEGDSGSQIELIYERLRKEPALETNLSGQTQEKFDGRLKAAVFEFQNRFGLPRTGKIDEKTRDTLNLPVEEIINKIIINIERLRWLQDTEDTLLIVNIPDFKLSFRKNGERQWEKKVIVGKTNRETPVFNTEIRGVMFNPRWYIPRSIAVDDFLPRQKRDQSYLEERNIRIYEEDNSSFHEVDPEEINWQKMNGKKFDYYLWQDAGPWNSLGKVIFRSPNSYHVYLHDTPEKHLFDTEIRTHSSGCVRVQNALEMAEFFVENYTVRSLGDMKKILNSGKEKEIYLTKKIPVYFLYVTAWINKNGEFRFLEDVYSKDKELENQYFNQ